MQLSPALRLKLALPKPSLRPLAWWCLGAVFYISTLTLPNYIATEDVDQSWSQLLAHLATTDARAGVDTIFPYGPCYDLVVHPFEAKLFWQNYAVEVLGKAVAAVFLIRFSRRLPPVAGRCGIVSLALLNLAIPLSMELYFLAAAAALITRRTIPDTIFVCLFLAVFSLSKFTACTFSLAGLAIVTFSLVRSKPRWHVLLPFSAYALSLAGVFVLRGQRLADLPAFLRSGFEYSSAYADGLALEGPTMEVYLALAILTLLAAATFTAGVAMLRQRFAPLGIVGLLAVLHWKIGFVRHDAHALSFFAMAFYLPALLHLTLHDAPRARLRNSILFGTMALSAFGFFNVIVRERIWPITFGSPFLTRWPDTLNDLTHPAELKARLERDREALAAKYALPRMKAIVGDATLDAYTDCQGVALLNGFNLAPRPTLQSVNAVAPAWLERNAAILRSDTAPRFLLVKWVSRDLRYPSLTDGPALLAILEMYDLVCEENGYLLLARRATPRMFSRETILEREAGIDEVIELPPGGFRTLTVDARFTTAGELRKAAYRPPVLFFLARDDAGEWHPYRLIAPMARVPFLLDPLCESDADWTTLFESRTGRHVTAIRLHVMRGESRFVEPRYTLKLDAVRNARTERE